jgi:hypothetical protein
MGRIVVLSVAPLLLLVATACDHGQKTSGQTPFDAEEVRAAFKAATGDQLVIRGTMPTLIGWGKVVVLEVQPEASHRYGEFGITVFENPERLKQATQEAGDQPDERSIYWHYTPVNQEGPVPTWRAAKNYRNVRLIWINGEKQTDTRWDVLDGALSTLLQRH